MGMREDIMAVRKDLEEVKNEGFAMEILIENSSKENEIVLDPFMGIGSTGVACKELNRNFIGIEIDEKYYKIACERINKEEKNTSNNIRL